MNSYVCIKGSWWKNMVESDYYRILEEVIKMSYIRGNGIILFKCKWFDTDTGMKVDPWHGLIEITHGFRAYVNEPFVLTA